MPRPRVLIAVIAVAVLAAAVVGLRGSSSAGGGSSAAPPGPRWRPVARVIAVVDVAGPRSDGRLVVSSRHGLFLTRDGRALRRFAAASYKPSGGEPYIAIASSRRPARGRCSFARDELLALDASSHPGVVRISRTGIARRL